MSPWFRRGPTGKGFGYMPANLGGWLVLTGWIAAIGIAQVKAPPGLAQLFSAGLLVAGLVAIWLLSADGPFTDKKRGN